MNKRKKGLGRGLGALLSDSDAMQQTTPSTNPKQDSIQEIPISSIEPNPFQPRQDFDPEALQELAESIKVHGIIQPITVRRLEDGKYQIISGERRWQASQLAGLTSVPAYVRTANDQQMLEMALIENIQRQDLNPIEIALSYQRLITECGLKQEELGERVGKKRSTVTNYLRLLKLPPDIQAGLRDGLLSMGHARALISLENPAQQLFIYQKIISEKLSVRQVEQLVQAVQTKTSPSQKPSRSDLTPELKQLQQRLSSHFGTKIQIKTGKSPDRGEIKIPFTSIDELNRLLEILNI
ncbi:ParB family chromosome partitioning protein [Thermonema lapsum]|uniref:ParB family chromosome partitioning protein n=1 Tax=Thermonema lapsum TaxID=28195 RepID=A0A846MP90_9BACT|nr:ParB/RepB/Spo0J family partition protein [Thermonema lapsum]NIK73210.1 ParB family chromosome partitioning protein [Thermonema lapsum]